MPAITTERLVRAFDERNAVDGLDLEIHEGEIYGFLGPNGAGKSTTVRVLCTLLSPTTGTAVVAGHDVARHPEQVRLRIGVALQDVALDPKQTGEIHDIIADGEFYGMQTFDQSLIQLVEQGRIDLAQAMQAASNPHDMKLALQRRPVVTSVTP